MRNRELADIFSEIADLMEILGEDAFRVSSYRRSARIIGEQGEDVADLLASGKLAELPGIGSGTIERVRQFIETGKIPIHEELLAKVPPGLLELLRIPGLGPKTAALVWRRLGVTSVDELSDALEAGKVAELPGMGEKKAEKIRQGIRFLAAAGGRTPLGVARPAALDLAERLKNLPGVARVEIAGSLRRWCETIGDIDLLVQAAEGEAVLKAFTEFPRVREVIGAGETKASVRIEGGLQVDVRVVPKASFGAAWQYFTGSKAHNVRLRELAVRKKWRLNEYGLFAGETPLAGEDEEGIYRALGLPWVPPELREDRGEIEHADALPKLIELKDIRGDLHMHTTATDGRLSIDEMVEACLRRGYQYLCITEHSRSSRIAGGLDARALARHVKKVRRAAETYAESILVLAGAEVDILADGGLDYDDAVLADLDLVLAAPHAGLSQSASQFTERLLRAMDNPHVRILAHPTGRLIGERPPAELDMARLVRHAAKTGTVLELNAAWQRLDLKDVHLRQAKEAGVLVAISTDAHDDEQLDYMTYGVYTARRGWLTAADVVNTRTARALQNWIGGGKSGESGHKKSQDT